MTAFADFKHLARGGKPHIQKHQVLPDTRSPGVAMTQLFPYQSYYDDTLLEQAILPQAVNEPIVNNDLTPMLKANIGGYSFGLHPSSQTPVAVQPITGGGQRESPQAVILRPGQIYRPHGRPDGQPGNFAGIKWGIPFGWLGGGVATLYVFGSPDADVAWPGNAEVLFHRQRMPVFGTRTPFPVNSAKNWPLRFPWTQAVGELDQSQAGAAIISISEPSRILMSLRQDTLPNPALMRIMIQGSNDFDVDRDGNVILSPVRFVDYIWGSYAGAPGTGGTSFDHNYPVVELTGEVPRLAADDGGITLIEIDQGPGLQLSGFVDIARYGRI